MKYYCPVCGYDGLEEKAYEDNFSSNEICLCCGFEYGVTDNDSGFSFESYRLSWLKSGAVFHWMQAKSSNWNMEIALTQLKNIHE